MGIYKNKINTIRFTINNFLKTYHILFYYHHFAIYLVLFVIMLRDLAIALNHQRAHTFVPSTKNLTITEKSLYVCQGNGLLWDRLCDNLLSLPTTSYEKIEIFTILIIQKKKTPVYLINGLAAANTNLWARKVLLLPSQIICKSAWCSPLNAAPISWSIHSPCLLYCSISILSEKKKININWDLKGISLLFEFETMKTSLFNVWEVHG